MACKGWCSSSYLLSLCCFNLPQFLSTYPFAVINICFPITSDQSRFWSGLQGLKGCWWVLLPKSYMDMSTKPWKYDFLYNNFHRITHPPTSSHWYTIFDRKALNFAQIGAFYQNLLKIHSFLNLGSFVSDNPSPMAKPNFWKKSTPKAWSLYRLHGRTAFKPHLKDRSFVF